MERFLNFMPVFEEGSAILYKKCGSSKNSDACKYGDFA